MVQNLSEYLATHECQGFRSVPHYVAAGDFVTYYLRDEPCYSRRVDDLLTVYHSSATDEMVGCKIKGVKHILQTAGDFGVTVDDGSIQLGLFFFIGAAMARNPAQRHVYEELGRVAKNVSFRRSDLQPTS